LFIALRVTRQPTDTIVTCQSGGFIASGSVGDDKAPTLIDDNLKTLKDEGFGERK